MLPRLKSLRSEFGISQKELAEALHISQQSIYKYEALNSQPDIEILKRMADYFGTSIDYLVGYSDIRRKAGASGEYSLSQFEAELIERIRTLSDEEKNCIDLVVHTFLKKQIIPDNPS